MEIRTVEIKRIVDETPDLSYLGKYTDKHEPGAIDRKNRKPGEYRYFVPTMTGEQTGNPNSPDEDYRRMEAYNDGYWHMIGIRAIAEVVFTGNVVQQIRSGGLYGIESDSSADYLAEVEREELAGLRAELLAVGFTDEQVTEAYAKM